jgi:hypothetical protein
MFIWWSGEGRVRRAGGCVHLPMFVYGTYLATIHTLVFSHVYSNTNIETIERNLETIIVHV